MSYYTSRDEMTLAQVMCSAGFAGPTQAEMAYTYTNGRREGIVFAISHTKDTSGNPEEHLMTISADAKSEADAFQNAHSPACDAFNSRVGVNRYRRKGATKLILGWKDTAHAESLEDEVQAIRDQFGVQDSRDKTWDFFAVEATIYKNTHS